jgi:ABC-type sugar transport system substrate-binding protein
MLHKRREISVLAVSIIFILLLALSGCNGGGSSSGDDTDSGAAASDDVDQSATSDTDAGSANSQAKDKYVIGASLADFTISFQAAMYDALEDAKADYPEFEFIIEDAKSDAATQSNQVETFIAQNVDALLINIVNEAVEPSLKKAIEAGIPVFTVNRGCVDPDAETAYIGANDVMSGEQMAGCLFDLMDSERLTEVNILYVQGIIGATYQKDRQGGFDATVADETNMKVNVLERVPCEHNKEKVISAVQTLLNKYPAGEVDAIVCEGPDDAVGALQAVKAAGRDELIGKIVGMDMPTAVWDAIKSGDLFGTVLQDPYEQCSVGVATVKKYLTEGPDSVEEKVITDLPIVTSANVNEVTPSW